MAGHRYLQGIPDKGPWDTGALVYWSEEQVDKVFDENVGDRKIWTPAGPPYGLQEYGGVPAVKLWI